MLIKKNFYLILIILVNFSIKNIDSARILASIFTPSFSHQIAFRPLWKELDKRGHQIVLITTDPMRDKRLKNIKEIDMHMSYDLMNKENNSDIVMGSWANAGKYMKALHDTSLAQLKHPEVQKLIHNQTEEFDLLMIEIAHPTHIGFIERWNVPLIGLSSLDAASRYHEVMGNTIHPVLNTDVNLSFKPPLSLLQRLISSCTYAITYLYGYWRFYPREDETVKEIFGNNSKPLWELIERMDMLFTNVNPVFHNIRAVTPTTLQFGGGVHLISPKPLPEDLKDFLDSSRNGVIYFNLGTNVKSKLLDERIKKILIETFSELPYKVLWKFEDQELLNKPENVFIRKWMPQIDILRHPNIKLFITQCGLQSMEEGILSHIPMVGLPFFGDQPQNSVVMEQKGFGRRLNPKTMTKKELKNTIIEVITNPQYKENIVEIADLLTDSEMSGLEKAVWWTEYIIRNKGAGLLKSSYSKVPLYQQFLLDVLAFIFISVVIVSSTIIKILTYLFNKKKRTKKNIN